MQIKNKQTGKKKTQEKWNPRPHALINEMELIRILWESGKGITVFNVKRVILMYIQGWESL